MIKPLAQVLMKLEVAQNDMVFAAKQVRRQDNQCKLLSQGIDSNPTHVCSVW